METYPRTRILLGIMLTLALGGGMSVRAAPAVSVSVSPTSVTLLTNGMQQFTATVTGSSNTAVIWSTTGGTISTTGLYTAPTAAGNYKVKATSAADTTKSASATVTVTAPVTVSMSPSSASLLPGGTQQFTASVTGSNNTLITWSTTGGSVSKNGLYTAPAAVGTYMVIATSRADGTSSASATVSVSAPVQHVVTLTWTASTSAVSGYNIYRGTTSGGPYMITNPALEPATTYVDDTVQSGTTYFYVVTSVDATGTESIFSNEATAVVPMP